MIRSSSAQLSSAKFFIGQAQLSSAQRKFFKFTTLPRRVDQRAADHRKQRRERRSNSEAEVHYRDVLYIQVNQRESPIIEFNGYEVQPF